MGPVTDERPLCVDLDGTLIACDLLVVAARQLAKASWWTLPLLPLWLLSGRARLKDSVFQRVTIDVANLPFHDGLLALLREEQRKGREIILATATPQIIARAVADHLGLFTDVIGSTPSLNLAGKVKANALVERFGCRGFDYVGNGHADVAVWREASSALVVSRSRRFIRKVANVCNVARVFAPLPPRSFVSF